MLVKSIRYVQFKNMAQEWKLEKCEFGNINLLVGRNATGKSRTLNVLNGLAGMLSGRRALPFGSGRYTVEFTNGGQEIVYELKYANDKVLKERLLRDGTLLMHRRVDGRGKMLFQQVKPGDQLEDMLEFETPANEIACYAKRDRIQHPFLEDLYNWSKSLRHYQFGTQMGRDILTVLGKSRKEDQSTGIDAIESVTPVALYRKGIDNFGDAYKQSIIQDMSSVGYELSDVSFGPPKSMRFIPPPGHKLGGDVVFLYVRERDLRGITDQNDMSQGMFRCLSLFIQMNYSIFAGMPSCLLVDDIGEGLDYGRSTALVSKVIEKAKGRTIQLMMATNDRFVMNAVPLEYWSVVERIGASTRMITYHNSPDIFREFELTGLNNFDFFSSAFWQRGQSRK